MKIFDAISAWWKKIMGKLGRGNQFPINVPTISLAASTATVVEGSTLVVTVNRTDSAYVSNCYLYTVAGTAGESDYTPHNGTLITFNAGETSKQVNVLITSDAVAEVGETFTVQIANPNLAIIGVNKCLVTITGQTITPLTVVSVTNSSVEEGGSNVHTITLSGSAGGQVSFAIESGTASIGDIALPPTFSNGVTLTSGVLTVPNGVGAFTATIATVEDSLVESNETYTINVGGIIATGTIVNDDSLPSATVASVSSPTVVEGANLVFNVGLSGPSIGQLISIVVSGTATNSADYGVFTFSNGVTLSGGNLSVPSGVSAFNITVPTVNDSTGEFSETVILTIGGVTGTGTITDNDAAVLNPITDIVVFEAPHGMLTAPQRTATAASGGYPMFAVSRDSIDQAVYAVYASSTIGGTYTKILDDQLFTPSGRLIGTISLDHRTMAVEDEKDFPTVITTNTVGLIADTAGQKEHCILTSYTEFTSGSDTDKFLNNVGIAAFDSVPIQVNSEDTARLYVLTNFATDPTLRANGATIYYKVVPKDGAGNELSLASVTPIALTITSRASKSLPPLDIKFRESLDGDFVNFPLFVPGDQLYIKVSPNSKTGGPYSYFNPASTWDAGVTAHVAVEGLNGSSTPVRILDVDMVTGIAFYSPQNRQADTSRYATKYTIYTQKDGIKSNAFTYDILQRPSFQNYVQSVALARVSSVIEATIGMEGAFGSEYGLGPERGFAYFELKGTLLDNVNLAGITFDSPIEFLYSTGDGSKFFVQFPRGQGNFKVYIPFTGGTGDSLEVRAGSVNEQRDSSITIT